MDRSKALIILFDPMSVKIDREEFQTMREALQIPVIPVRYGKYAWGRLEEKNRFRVFLLNTENISSEIDNLPVFTTKGLIEFLNEMEEESGKGT